MSSVGNTITDPSILGGTTPARGVDAAQRMLRSDIPLSAKSPYLPSPMWKPDARPPMVFPTSDEAEAADIKALRDYVQGLEANRVVPPERSEGKTAEPAKKEEDGPKVTFQQPRVETELKEGGTSETWRRGVERDLRTGETTRNPKGTHEVDNDFRGKFDERKIKLGEVKVEDKVSGAVRDGKFGDKDSFLSGEGSVFGGEAGYEGTAGASNKGVELGGKVSAGGHLMKGEVKTRDGMLGTGKAEGAVGSVEAEAKTEIVLSPDEAVASGALKAEANLVKGKLGGEVCVTPRRVYNLGVSAYNWIVNENYKGLDENWDIGVCVGGEAGLSVGAQIGGEAEASYKKGKAKVGAGGKIGLGVGAEVKGHVGATGLDRVWNWFRGSKK